MTATSTRDQAEHLVPVSVAARHLPASIVAVGALLSLLFVSIVLVMVFAVLGDETPDAPALEDLPVSADVEVIASMETCTDRACDGLGAALAGSPGQSASSQLATEWRDAGWNQLSCVDGGSLCFGMGDLRLSMTAWVDMDEASVPMLVDTVAEHSIDPRRLVFVHYYRCGSIHPCE